MTNAIHSSRSPSSVSSSRSLKAGDIVVLKQGEAPPKAPAGLEWKYEGSLESLPPKDRYRLVEAADASSPSSSSTPKLGDLLTLKQGETPPQAPEGFEWRFNGSLETLPPKDQYKLVQSAPAQSLIQTMEDAYQDGFVSKDEVKKMICAAESGGVTLGERDALYQTFIKTTSLYDSQSATEMRSWLMENGIEGGD